jgi:hypothetical protein
MGIRKPRAALLVFMELQVRDHDEPSHIHVPRPSRTARGPVQIQSSCPANICAELQDQRKDYPTFADLD